MQRNAIMQKNNSMQCNAINAMHCKQCLAGVVVGASDGARHVAFYASEMHDLHACIQEIMFRDAILYRENTVRTRFGISKIVPLDS